MTPLTTRLDPARPPADYGGRARLTAVALALAAMIALDPQLDRIAFGLSSIRDPFSARYGVRYMLMHHPRHTVPGELRVILIGNSTVRGNFDEKVLADALVPQQYCSVANFGVDGAWAMSSVALADQVARLSPGVLIWGVEERTFRWAFRTEYARPWCTEIAAEFGSSAMYRYVPGLPGIQRAISQDLLLSHWRLFRYRYHFCVYLIALGRSLREGTDQVFGPYESVAQQPDPMRLQAALRRPRTELDPPRSQREQTAVNGLVNTTLSATCRIAQQAGSRPVVVWLPKALDTATPDPPELEVAKRTCSRLGVSFIDLRGALPVSAFNDTQHTNRDGKEQLTQALIPHLRQLLDQTPGGSR